MFHVKHYSKILNFYKKNNCSSIKNISLDSLVDLIYSSYNRKIIFYHDSLYSKIVDSIDINWDDDKCLILAPKNNYSVSAPIGFNQYNQHTTYLLVSTYHNI